MNIENLLSPRFEVIADYPMSNFKVGSIYLMLYLTKIIFIEHQIINTVFT